MIINSFSRQLTLRILFVLVAAAGAAAQAPAPYRLVPNWGMLPAGTEWGEVPAAAVDAKDIVLVFRRSEPPVFEFDRAGKLLKSW